MRPNLRRHNHSAWLEPGHPSVYLGFNLHANNRTYSGWLRVGLTFDGAGNPLAFSLLAKDGAPDIYGAWSTGAISLGEVGSAAAVPEPAQVATGLGLLALGAVGVREFRRRRRQDAA